jgi:hypothetical protein
MSAPVRARDPPPDPVVLAPVPVAEPPPPETPPLLLGYVAGGVLVGTEDVEDEDVVLDGTEVVEEDDEVGGVVVEVVVDDEVVVVVVGTATTTFSFPSGVGEDAAHAGAVTNPVTARTTASHPAAAPHRWCRSSGVGSGAGPVGVGGVVRSSFTVEGPPSDRGFWLGIAVRSAAVTYGRPVLLCSSCAGPLAAGPTGGSGVSARESTAARSR